MIIAWWHKDIPQVIDLIEEDILPRINANWIEKRQATKEEIKIPASKAPVFKAGKALKDLVNGK